MRIYFNHLTETQCREKREFQLSRIRIGRDETNEVVLDSHFVAPVAAILERTDRGWSGVATSFDGIIVNDVEVTEGERFGISGPLTLRIYPYTLTLEPPTTEVDDPQQIARRLDLALSESIRQMHLLLLQRLNLAVARPVQAVQNEEQLKVERFIEEILSELGYDGESMREQRRYAAARVIRAEMLGDLFSQSESIWSKDQTWKNQLTAILDREEELRRLLIQVGKQIPMPAASQLSAKIDAIETHFLSAWSKCVGSIHPDLLGYLAARFFKKELKDIIYGYGPIEDLLHSPVVTEIMVVDRDHIYVERSGVLENSGRRFVSDEVTQTIIERIVAKVGRRIDKSKPLVDARLADGSRVNAVIPPIAVSGPCLTIRKFPARKMGVEDLVTRGSLTAGVAEFLRAAVLCKCNIVVSGGTGTGKTTLLNCLSDFIGDRERIVTIEDTAELQLKKEHWVRLETKQENVEGTGAFTIRDLVKNALRMRPDRIVVGECRGPEALDMLQAMNTGHDGSMTTLHANSARDAILRLEVLVQMAADLPIDSIHRQIGSACDLIVQLARERDGRRRITQVTEVVGVNPRGGGLQLRDLFLSDEKELFPTGSLPTFMPKLLETGRLHYDIFFSGATAKGRSEK